MKLSRIIVYSLLGILAWFVLVYNPKTSKNGLNDILKSQNMNLSSSTSNILSRTDQNVVIEENSLHYEYKRNPFVLNRPDVIIKGEEPTQSIEDYAGDYGAHNTGTYQPSSRRKGVSLEGITIVGNKRTAIVNGEVVNVGNSVAGCRVVGIGKNNIIVSSGGKNITLKVKD